MSFHPKARFKQKKVGLTIYRDCKEGVQSFFEKREPKFEATLEDDGPPTYPWWTEVDTGKRAKADVKSKAKL